MKNETGKDGNEEMERVGITGLLLKPSKSPNIRSPQTVIFTF